MSESNPAQRARPQVALAALSIALVVAVAAAIWGWVDRPSSSHTPSPSVQSSNVGAAARTEMNGALAAANRIATDLTTYSYQTLDADYARMAADGTAEFAQTLRATSADAQAVARRLKIVSESKVLSASALPPAADGTVTVLAFVQQRLDSVESSTARTEVSQLLMVMKHVAGKWIVEQASAKNLT